MQNNCAKFGKNALDSAIHTKTQNQHADSTNLPPKHTLKSLIFSQKGCTHHLLPPTIKLCPQKLSLFAFRGRASLNPLLAKNRRLHFCNLESDFLHHEAGEINGASHESLLDSTIQTQIRKI